MTASASAFCGMVAREPGISHAAARFGAWLIGAAEMTGGFPLELTLHQVRFGFVRDGVGVSGMGGRYETIDAAIKWYTDKGFLECTEGRPVGFGYTAVHYTLSIP